MKTAVHQYEDKLLEFAYGELPAHEAAAVTAHLQTCQKCTQSLAQLQSVRSTMQKLPVLEAPIAGLDSLLAYAEQTAHRNKTAKAPLPWYRRFLVPLASVAALTVIGVVGIRASSDFNPKFETQQSPTATKSARAQEKELGAPKEQPAPAPALANAPEPVPARDLGGFPYGSRAPDDRVAKRGASDGEGRAEKAALGVKSKADLAEAQMESRSRLDSLSTKKVAKDESADLEKSFGTDKGLRQDYSNAAQRGAYNNKFDTNNNDSSMAGRADMPVTPAKVAEAKPVAPSEVSGSGSVAFETNKNLAGVSTGGAASTGTGNYGLRAGDTAANLKQGYLEDSVVAGKKPVATAPPPPSAQVAQPTAPAAVVREESKKVPATTAAAPAPKKSLAFKTYGSSSAGPTPSDAEEDRVAVQTETVADSKRANDDGDYARRATAKAVDDALLQSRSAANRGDTRGAINAALVALNGGAEGYAQVEALKRLCDGYEALGDTRNADTYCDALIRNHGTTAAARVVMERRRNSQSAGTTGAGSRKMAAPAAEKSAPEKADSPAKAEPAL